MNDASEIKDLELVEWVTPLTTYGHKAVLNWAYGDVCMIVRIGKAGDRLAFPAAGKVKRAYLESWRQRHGNF